jgi:hypothetical protein
VPSHGCGPSRPRAKCVRDRPPLVRTCRAAQKSTRPAVVGPSGFRPFPAKSAVRRQMVPRACSVRPRTGFSLLARDKSRPAPVFGPAATFFRQSWPAGPRITLSSTGGRRLVAPASGGEDSQGGHGASPRPSLLPWFFAQGFPDPCQILSRRPATVRGTGPPGQVGRPRVFRPRWRVWRRFVEFPDREEPPRWCRAFGAAVPEGPHSGPYEGNHCVRVGFSAQPGIYL